GGYAFVLPHLGRAIRARRASPDFLAEADLDQFTPIATPEPVEVEAPPAGRLTGGWACDRGDVSAPVRNP
ncbi:MAG TPA: hypothetical protein VFG47_13450, partial [Geminicoccaceae bacterium]|nr:hypothetical protein [Geminicoccaceae bacterium]